MDTAAIPRYAQALFQAAQKSGEIEKVDHDLRELSKVLKPSGLGSYLENPRYNLEKKTKVLSEIEGHFHSKLMTGFLNLLLRKVRITLIYGIACRFNTLMNDHLGIVPVEVTLSGKPNEAFVKRIEKFLKALTGKEVEITFKEDAGIVGGVQIQYQNRIIDGSVQNRLEKLKKILLETQIN
jgi:F-type H+-transporting ATPase subunit delta